MESLNDKKGVLAWFAQNHVAANLLMLLIIVGGIISLSTNIVEMFPQMSVDIITVRIWGLRLPSRKRAFACVLKKPLPG